MNTPDINHILKLYLGTDAKGGYQPIGCDERLRAAFPKDYARMIELISPYLAADQPQEDWGAADTLGQAADHFAEKLRHKFPELDATSIRALANRGAFGYR